MSSTAVKEQHARIAAALTAGGIGASASPDSSVRSEPETSEKADTSKLISAGHESFDLIFMMLLGIRTAISKFANVPQRELAPNEFDDKWDGDFLAKGSADTPAHTQQDFRFRDFSPLVFRQIREHFGVTNEEYLLSLTSEYVLVEMFTNSKSGSFFYYSTDYRFILKTCTKNEAAFLIKALPRYHGHLMAHRYTLLCRFFGLHRVHLPTTLGKKVYFVVMGNVLPIDKPIHERYDLKGSTRGRITSEAERQDPNVVLKDLDWIRAGRKLHLGPDKKRRLLTQVRKDCALLEALEVIDYSLFIGIHRASSARSVLSRERDASRFYKLAHSDGRAQRSGGGGGGGGGGSGPLSPLPPPPPPLMDTDERQRGASVQIVEAVSQQQLHREHQRRAPRDTPSGGGGGGGWVAVRANEPEEPEVGREVYFIGCIDILCEYGLRKQLEHQYKAAQTGEMTGAQNFSVVDPLQYSNRFQNFVADALD